MLAFCVTSSSSRIPENIEHCDRATADLDVCVCTLVLHFYKPKISASVVDGYFGCVDNRDAQSSRDVSERLSSSNVSFLFARTAV